MSWLLWTLIYMASYFIVGLAYAHWNSPAIWREMLKEYPPGAYTDAKRAKELLMFQRMTVFLWPVALLRDVFYAVGHLAFPTPEELDETLKEKRRVERERLLEREAFDD